MDAPLYRAAGSGWRYPRVEPSGFKGVDRREWQAEQPVVAA